MTPLSGEAPLEASSRHSPVEAIRIFLRRLPRPCRLLVAFSGGGDSAGLLAALEAGGRGDAGLSIRAATVDHGLRAGSAEEAQAASAFCEKFGVPHAILRWTGDKPAAGIQAKAREARYRLLAGEAARVDADFILTGHTRDDQLETIAMRRTRDPGTTEGMDEAVLVGRRIWVLRPFLCVAREAIRDYLRERHLSWIEDPSNVNPAFERVRLRLAGNELSAAGGRVSSQSVYVDAARFVRDNVKPYPGLVASVDLAAFRIEDAGHRIALLTLAAVLGGREHLPGKETVEKIIATLRRGSDFRLSASRVVFDRRKQQLFLGREARELPELTIGPGEAARWDGRYEITNHGWAAIVIAAGQTFAAAPPLFPLPDPGQLPKAVVRRASAAMPRLVAGNHDLKVRPVLAPFEHFLPSRKLALANSLATVLELEHFPSLSLGNGGF